METVITNCDILSDVSFFREKMNRHNFIFSYRGKMSHKIVKNLLSLTEKKIDSLHEDGTIKKKIFGVMINCLQTICSNEKEANLNEETLFMINKTDSGYMIFNGVYIKSEHGKLLSTTLDNINQLSSESLSDLRKEKLLEFKAVDDSFSIDEATLGLINIAKKTGKRIEYNIEKLDNEQDFFTLQIHIE